MALCTQLQVEQRLQITFDNQPEPIVTELIKAATGHIDRVIGRNVEAAAREEIFDAPESPNVWLTHTPVIDTSTTTPFAVAVDGDTLSSTDYSVDPETGRLTRVANGRPRSWATRKVQSIEVDYEGGYSTVPYDIQDICARMVARAFQSGSAYASAGTAGIKQVALQGSDSVTFDKTASDISSALFLTEDEHAALRVYRNSVVA